MIQFHSRKSFYKTPFGAITKNTDLLLRIKVSGERPVASARLVLSTDQSEVSRVEGETDEPLNCEAVFRFSLTMKQTGLFFYYFEVTYITEETSGILQDNMQCQEQGQKKEQQQEQKQEQLQECTPVYQLTVYSEDYRTPDWLKAGVMYQIFPDRFAKSESYKAPRQDKNYILRDDWGGIPNGEPDENGIVRNNDFFGGNLRGIIEKLDYLEHLGVTVIYLNPIFEAYSNHRYDTADYKKIDPMLGTEEDFRELCEQAGKKGIRIILDGVFNHTGSDSLYFNKRGRYPKPGAYQSKESPYFTWYRFTEYPEKYDSWWGIDTLPGINETEPSYLDYMIWSEDSVIRHWLRCGASGFRLDVADELPNEFLESLRTAVKEVKPDGAVIGEVWEDASNKISYGQRRKYFLGKQLDTVMNYPLKDAIIDYLVHDRNGVKLEQLVNSLWENYPAPAFSTLMNILGTHDTPRILTILSENSKDEDYTRQRLFLALLITAFMPGIPCIYYGDEIGMKGGKDPQNRMCFDPGHGDTEILRFFRRLFLFRKKMNELKDYGFKPRSAEGSFYSYCRIGGDERLIIAANAGNQDYLLNLAMKEKEYLKDFFISGHVTFERQGVFRIRENSGIAAFIRQMP